MQTKLCLTTAAMLAMATACLQADAYSDTVISLNPDIYYRLDEESIFAAGAPAIGTIATNLGSGGATLDGYYQSLGSTVVSTGKSGGATAGNSGIDTTGWAVRTPDSSFASGNTAFSFFIWAKPASFGVGDYGMILGYGDGIPNGNAMLLSEDGANGTGKLIFGRYGANLFTSNGSMAAGGWNSIGVTYDGVGTIKLYLNGVLDTEYTGTIDPFGNQYAVLGNLFTDASTPFVGGLDEFAYWIGTELSEMEMQLLMPVNYTYETAPDASYPDITGNKLMDGGRSPTGSFSDPRWVGFNLLDIGGPAVVTFDLQQQTHINGVTLGFLSAAGVGVNPLESFSVSFSSDGVNYGPEQSFSTTDFERGMGISFLSTATRTFNGQGRFVRLSMNHTGGETSSFLFVDEVTWLTSNSTKEVNIPLTSATYIHNTGNEPWATYPDTDGVELYDGLLASNVDYSDPAWTSWNLDTGGAPQVIFDFGGQIRFSQVGLRFMNQPDAGIAAPESISVSYSLDGVNFYGTQNFTTTATERDPSGVGAPGIGRVERNLSGTGRYLKFEANHAQAPAIPLIMIDELQFSGAVLLGIEKSGGNLILKWASGTLEESADLISGFTELPAATSPYTVTPAGKHFFRVRYQ